MVHSFGVYKTTETFKRRKQIKRYEGRELISPLDKKSPLVFGLWKLEKKKLTKSITFCILYKYEILKNKLDSSSLKRFHYINTAKLCTLGLLVIKYKTLYGNILFPLNYLNTLLAQLIRILMYRMWKHINEVSTVKFTRFYMSDAKVNASILTWPQTNGAWPPAQQTVISKM